MMKTIYLLTKEGRFFTDQGRDYILAKTDEYFKSDEAPELIQGELLNRASYLGKCLTEHMDGSTVDDIKCCIAVSSKEKGIAFVGGTKENIEEFISEAQKHPDKTSWQIFSEMVDNANQS